uniref:Apolipoprotein D n=1 Tax=Daphnia magna TaxID=35525 RepID=A0A0P6G530_9CRUS
MPLNYSLRCVFLLVAVGLFRRTKSQILTIGSCPNPSVVSEFEVDQYLGKWYYNRNYFSIFKTGLDCTTVEYTMNEDEITIKIEGFLINNKKKKTTFGKARVVTSGKLTVTFIPNALTQGAENYWILDTDYTSYAVVWNCFPHGLMYSSTAWILTRERNPSSATIDLALAAFEKNDIDQTKLKLVNQQDCE